MKDGPKTGFAFVIDTDKYAGNFERDMTAYITGVTGECGVGDDMIIKDEIIINFENVKHVADDNGCYRPTSIWELENNGPYNAVAIFFDSRPSAEQISFMKERVKKFPEARQVIGRMAKFHINKPLVNIIGFRLIEFKSEQITETI